MNTVSKKNIEGTLTFVCSCGAKAPLATRAGRRFILEHPKLCSEPRFFTQAVSQTPPRVQQPAVAKDRPDRWEAVEKALRQSGVIV